MRPVTAMSPLSTSRGGKREASWAGRQKSRPATKIATVPSAQKPGMKYEAQPCRYVRIIRVVKVIKFSYTNHLHVAETDTEEPESGDHKEANGDGDLLKKQMKSKKKRRARRRA